MSTYLEDMATSYASGNSVGLADMATFAGQTGPVFLNRPDLMILASNAKTTEYQARLKTALFPTIARGDTLTINGIEYAVRKVEIIEDGTEKVLALSRVTL